MIVKSEKRRFGLALPGVVFYMNDDKNFVKTAVSDRMFFDRNACCLSKIFLGRLTT